jgi:tRNA threonylcarbamoyladenosine dehydratase
MLARSGVGRLRLIDFDQVTMSSLNRHAVATLSDVGISKATATKQHLLKIVPWCQIEDITEMFIMQEANRLLSTFNQGQQPIDLVIDCIDDVNTKADLIAYCLSHSIPVITSMGAGGKADPTRLRIAPLSECINDPLAQKIKWKLKKQYQVTADQVMSVFSVEKPLVDLLPLNEEQANEPQVSFELNLHNSFFIYFLFFLLLLC